MYRNKNLEHIFANALSNPDIQMFHRMIPLQIFQKGNEGQTTSTPKFSHFSGWGRHVETKIFNSNGELSSKILNKNQTLNEQTPI